MIDKGNINTIIRIITKELESNINVFTDASVEYGLMGVVVYYYYCDKYYDDRSFLIKGEAIIEKTINLLSKVSFENQNLLKFQGDSIGHSISSFGKGLLFIQNRFNHNYDFSENHSFISDVLFEITKQALTRKDHDYFTGSLSAGYYYLNNYIYYKDTFSKYALNLIVDSILEDGIIYNDNEVYWHSPSFNNRVYLGLSHGSAMIINFLVKIMENDIYEGEHLKIQNILYKAITFVMNRERGVLYGFFPHQFLEQESLTMTQLSMCYGDLGILYAIHNAKNVLNYNEFDSKLKNLLLKTSKRELNKAFTEDASILYGCSGLYHIYKELYNLTSNNIFLEASNYWYEKIFEFNIPYKTTLAGFQFEYEKSLEVDISAKFSFLWGIAGIGITLMIRNNPSLPKLNELLLIGLS